VGFPLELRFVKRAEGLLGRRLPLGYVAKMCRDNGGDVDIDGEVWWLYPIFDDSDRKRVSRTCNDVVRETASAREWPGFPPNALAIAHNGSGDHLVFLFDTDTDRYDDAVHRWDHETREVNEVASAFEELNA
jgi:hypothetical protein